MLPVGHELGTPDILFAKIEDEAIEAQRDLLAQRAAEATTGEDEGVAPGDAEAPYEPLKDLIAFDDFVKLDLRVGRIVAAEPHPKADKLLRLDVDLGFETRQVLAGVRMHMTPEELHGKHVVVAANLAPRTIRGLESQGMLLFAENRDGRLVPVLTDGEPGGPVR